MPESTRESVRQRNDMRSVPISTHEILLKLSVPPLTLMGDDDDDDGGKRNSCNHRIANGESRRHNNITVTAGDGKQRCWNNTNFHRSGGICIGSCARNFKSSSRCIGCGCVTTNGRRQKIANKKRSIASSHNDIKHAHHKAAMMVFICACSILLLSTNYLVIVEASSSSGNSGNAPFLVMSEITVQATNENENDGTTTRNIQSSTVVRNQSSGSTEVTDVNNSESGEVSSGTGENNDVNSDEHMSIVGTGGGNSGSDTDGEDEDKLGNESNDDAGRVFDVQNSGESPLVPPSADGELASSSASELSAAASSASQPLRTLKRLQAMLDDSDYATHTVASGAAVIDSTNIADGSEVENNAQAITATTTTTATQIQATSSSSSSDSITVSPSSHTEQLWTSKDRSKYRRTRRTEKQRQQQQQRGYYEEAHARKIRDIQRQRIIREERERKEMVELRRKQEEVTERQQYEQQRRRELQQQFLSEPDFTDDDTDTDGKGFELPNLPVYLSDAEATDDFSEETEGAQPNMQQQHTLPDPVRPSLNYPPPNPRQGYTLPNQNIDGQNAPKQPYEYTSSELQQQQRQRQQQQPPPQQTNNSPYQNYQQQFPQQFPQQQQQQQQTIPQQYQYNPNPQQIQQYEQQYAAWAQAAANGYYYPPPQPPSTASFQQHQQQQAQQQGQQRTQQQPPPQSSYTPQQHPYATQQQQNQGPYAEQARQSYLRQHQQPSARAYPNIPPRQASFPAHQSQSQAASTATYQGTGERQRGFFNRESGEEQPSMERGQQKVGSLNGHVGGALPNYLNGNPATHSTMTGVDPMSAAEGEEATPTNITTATASSNNGQMAVNSAFVSPAAPLISSPTMPSSSKIIVAPIDAEEMVDESAVLIAGTESRISFDSIQKLSFSTLGVALLSYCAVSPRSLPFPEYNRLFLQNLSIVWLAAIGPVFLLLAVYDGKYNNINTVIGTFHVSFTLGYALAFISEIFVTTAVRLGVFKIWEPAIFSLTPEVPSIILPWVLREKQYKPKRITLFAADFAASCVASPIIEEYLKLKVMQWTCKLPRNFKQSINVQKTKRRKKLSYVLQPVRSKDAPQVANINCYITQMLAASLGLKLFDVSRRILMYTKETDEYKRIYAVYRGTFPIHELCGTMTALLLARRDVVGVNLPQWKIIGPAVFLHAMANFRGMKPIFKWNSSTPWSEMQINQLKKDNNGHIWKQLIPQTYSKLVWMTILFRVFGFCIKNYYLVGRQAMKRTTMYSGKLYAFNAKLQTDAMLKKTKND